MENDRVILKFWKKVIFISIPIVIIAFLYAIYNLHYDPYGIFHSDLSKQIVEPNQHFIKMRFLIKNPGKGKKVIFGSSREGNLRAELFGYYNMSYSEALPAEIYDDITLLLKSGVNIKEILIGFDNISYLVNQELHKTQFLRKTYSNNFSDLKTYFEYLFIRPGLNIHKEIVNPHKFNTDWTQLFISGRPVHLSIDSAIDNFPEQHINDPKFNIPVWQNYYIPRIDQAISEIKNIVDISHNHNIKLTIFINPMYKDVYLKQNFVDYFSFLRKLANITAYYDFSGLNKITENKMNYYETSHFRVKIGDLMLGRMLQRNQDTTFGIFVNSVNIEQHINALKKQLHTLN